MNKFQFVHHTWAIHLFYENICKLQPFAQVFFTEWMSKHLVDLNYRIIFDSLFMYFIYLFQTILKFYSKLYIQCDTKNNWCQLYWHFANVIAAKTTESCFNLKQ